MDNENSLIEHPDPSSGLEPSRRDFMKAMALLFTGTAAYAMTPNFAYAQSDSPQLEDLADVCHTLFPHKHVPRKFYLACAQGLLDKAADDEELQGTIDTGLKRLNTLYSRGFKELDQSEQDMAIQRVINTPFFDAVRGHTVVGLYNIPEVWDYFGYQGSSYEKGGYINRGFDDVYWIDDLLDAEEIN